MKRFILMAAAALALAACSPDAPKPGEQPKIDELASPRIAGRLFSCDLTYFSQMGPITQESRADVRMGIDTAPATGGWQVVSLSVMTPLPDANGFDPWLPLHPGPQRAFAGSDGPALVLTVASGAPISFNTLTGALDWRVPGSLGDSGYRGVCY